MSKNIQAMFDDIAPSYDKANRIMSLGTDLRWRKKAIAECLAKDPDSVLDLCAGTLDLSQALLKKKPNLKVASCDFSLAMLEFGKDKVDKNSRQIICGDGHHLPFIEQSFEACICAFGIRNLEKREIAIQEIRRVLKKDSRLVILEFFKPSNWTSKLFYKSYGQNILPFLGGIISKNKQAYKYLFQSIQDFLSLEEYCQLLEKHQFKIISKKNLSGGIASLIVAEAE